jgi:hypothetical protein
VAGGGGAGGLEVVGGGGLQLTASQSAGGLGSQVRSGEGAVCIGFGWVVGVVGGGGGLLLGGRWRQYNQGGGGISSTGVLHAGTLLVCPHPAAPSPPSLACTPPPSPTEPHHANTALPCVPTPCCCVPLPPPPYTPPTEPWAVGLQHQQQRRPG